MWKPSTCDCECTKGCKVDKYLNSKTSLFEKRLIGKLILGCKDEILNTTETSLDDKKVTCEKMYLPYSYIGSYILVNVSCHFC